MADGKHPQFAVIPAIIGKIQRIAAKHLRCVLKIQPTFRKRRGTLDRIAGDLHLVIVATNNQFSKSAIAEFALYPTPPPARSLPPTPGGWHGRAVRRAALRTPRIFARTQTSERRRCPCRRRLSPAPRSAPRLHRSQAGCAHRRRRARYLPPPAPALWCR